MTGSQVHHDVVKTVERKHSMLAYKVGISLSILTPNLTAIPDGMMTSLHRSCQTVETTLNVTTI